MRSFFYRTKVHEDLAIGNDIILEESHLQLEDDPYGIMIGAPESTDFLKWRKGIEIIKPSADDPFNKG